MVLPAVDDITDYVHKSFPDVIFPASRQIFLLGVSSGCYHIWCLPLDALISQIFSIPLPRRTLRTASMSIFSMSSLKLAANFITVWQSLLLV